MVVDGDEEFFWFVGSNRTALASHSDDGQASENK